MSPLPPAVGTDDPALARLLDWAGATVGGVVVGHERLPTVRPAWKVILQGGRGATTPYVIRCARPAGFGLSSVYSLGREAGIVRALHGLGFPVPAVRASHTNPEALLLDCLPGRSDFNSLDADDAHKARVVGDFIGLLARLHAFRPAELGLDGSVAMPLEPRQHALQEVVIWDGLYRNSTSAPDPLICFSLDWLRTSAPVSPETVLVQGDTGPNQCLFDERGVTAVLDWELAHFGDPMEDLGWIAARSFFARFGELPAIFGDYARRSGRDLDFARIGYYRVMALAKCAIATGLAREKMGPADDLASIVCWDSITRLGLAWSLAHGFGLAPMAPDLPAADGQAGTQLHRVLAQIFHQQALAASGAFDRQRLEGLAAIVRLLGAELESSGTLDRDWSADRLPEHGPQRASSFLAREQQTFAACARAFGERARIHFEPLR